MPGTHVRWTSVSGVGLVDTMLLTVPDLQLGDVLAITYLTRHDNTGHIMLVDGKPKR
jgi:hypothetical protein